MTPAPEASTVLVDCRWLGHGGAGRLTELLLRSLAPRPPRGRWVLWGPEPARRLAWPGAEVALTDLDPRAGLGQRGWFQLPRCDLAVFMHQQRPLRRVRAVTFILDTTALRIAAHPAERLAKRAFLRRVAAVSDQVVTISRYSRDCIARDLAVPVGDVEVLPPPADDDLAKRVARLRDRHPRQEAALYVGTFLPHKNLPRLLAAFARTRFREGGGRLWLVGGDAERRRQLLEIMTAEQRGFVELRGNCDDGELARLYATASFLVQPSLEEGFGLPVLEALSCGLPVCVSDGGALPEITAGVAEPFPATSVAAMAAGLDAVAGQARRPPAGPPPGPPRWRPPTTVAFARRFEEIVWRTLH